MAYASTSAADRLAAVRVGIDKVLNGQEYWVNGRKVRYADLSSLMELERELSWEAAQEDGSVPVFSPIQIDSPGPGV